MTLGTPLAEEGPQRPGDARSALFRQVSQDALSEAAGTTPTGGTTAHGNRARTTPLMRIKADGRGSPARCVSEFDRVSEAAHSVEDSGESFEEDNNVPAFVTPLAQAAIFSHHVASVRLEAELHPFRLIVARLMASSVHNRKGLFNAPVDPVALQLPDYYTVVQRPMDLGTVRTKLHSMHYNSRQQVVEDIRLVFTNAMRYNPPTNAVHGAAKELLAYFEEQLEAWCPEANKSGEASSAPLRAQAEGRSPICATSAAPGMLALSTRNSSLLPPLSSVPVESKKRKKRCAKSTTHSCQSCLGRKCEICLQGCLSLEPTLLICSGVQCCGARIRKGGVYYIAPDGSRQYCDRCYSGLPAVLPATAADATFRYKRSLLKRKNDEEVVEEWLSCKSCHGAVHKICAMFNEFTDNAQDFVCQSCTSADGKSSPLRKKAVTFAGEEAYTYVSGSVDPVPLSQLMGGHPPRHELLTADQLPESCVSLFIQGKVQDVLRSGEFPNADRTISVRVISDSDRYFRVPDVVRNHFRFAAGHDIDEDTQRPPSRVHYRSKAIALFQKIDGVDVCIFCMYVHEYDGNDSFDQENRAKPCSESKRVYIAYLDSVEHFRPRPLRTSVYHEILVSYLATARLRGYETAHIWACPPCRGNSFVFWSYPNSQRTPTQERLRGWYHESLLRALDKGVLTDVKSLYETDFEPFALDDPEEGIKCENVCPPLLDGDYWVEEAMRLHAISLGRQLRSRTVDGIIIPSAADKIDPSEARCPALEVATLLREKVIADPVSLFFRKPVNAAALNLKDYHRIITQPMDLGTIYAKCMIGEYSTLKHFVQDVELVVANAKKYNPPGHIVHTQADALKTLFLHHLNEAVKTWPLDDVTADDWTAAEDISLHLDARFSSDSASEVSVVSGSSQTLVPEKENSISVADILAEGASAVEQRMAGNDAWLLEKKSSGASGKGVPPSKKAQQRRRKSTASCASEPPAKRRRQTWLAEEVCASVRKMRMALFSCTLKNQETSAPENQAKELEFAEYARSFNAELDDTVSLDSTLADARHALLEFSQFRNLQFDTLRRAKYSTAVLLYHLHNPEAPGVVPCCSACGGHTGDVRWHKLGKVIEQKRSVAAATPAHMQKKSEHMHFSPEEICSACFAARSDQSDFIPVQVTCS
jgi:hypothetical protein